MSNYLSILGFGQCGSTIAVDISATFNPSNILSGESPVSASLSVLIKNFRKKVPKNLDDAPAFYIADLNTSNETYIRFSKAQAIRECLPHLDNLSTKEIVERVNRNRNGVLIKESDINIVEEVKKKHNAFKMIKSLYFEARKKPLLEVGGAGGLQYLSEAIADQDTNLMNSIDQRNNGALIGLFAMGGGTGSGSLFAVLSNYKRITSRYTVGMGVLPTRTNIDEYTNAGRYLAKYMGTSSRDRFHTLILFSNEAADKVLMEEDAQHEGMEPIKIINEYISEFIHDFSLINDEKTIVKFGKMFDTMDGKRFLSGICTIGYCAATEFSPREFFTKAMSPLTYENNCLSGLTVRITQEQFGNDVQRKIGKLVKDIVAELEDKRPNDRDISYLSSDVDDGEPSSEGLGELKENIKKLQELTPFYGTVKQVRVFYFIKNTRFVQSAYRFQLVIRQFFQTVSGDKVKVDVTCYYVPSTESQVSSILILFGGAFCFEIYESVLQFAQQSFLIDEETRKAFTINFNSELAGIKNLQLVEAKNTLDKSVGNILTDGICSPVESTEGIDRAEIYHNPDLAGVITNEKIKEILLSKETLKISLVEIMSNFTLGDRDNELPDTPF